MGINLLLEILNERLIEEIIQKNIWQPKRQAPF
jgi:hypothetical protein